MYLPLFLLLIAAFLLFLNMKTGKGSPVGKYVSYVGMWAVLIWSVVVGVQVYG